MSSKTPGWEVGGFSTPSKMPWYAWSIPATECKTGSKLAQIPGSVCSKCYALKGRYMFPNVQNALYARYMKATSPNFVDNFVDALTKAAAKTTPEYHYFRWFDSGDLQDQKMLDDIIEIARRTPHIRHWLPTKEYSLITNNKTPIPPNLLIRVSAPMIDGPAPNYTHTSTVSSSPAAVTCPAPTQNNKCQSCRACWDFTVDNVVYSKH